MVIEGKIIQIQRGDILIIQANVVHGVLTYGRGGEHYMGYRVKVSKNYLAELVHNHRTLDRSFDEYKHIRTRGTLWERIDQLFLLTSEELQQREPGWESALLGCSLLMLIQIARAAIVDPNEKLKLEKGELLNQILTYVEFNLGEKITLEDTAKKFFISSSTVTQLFQKKMNISFYKYVMQRRLSTAKNLIAEGMAMEKIALRVGFGDYSAFYRAFRQEYDMSPRQFDKTGREE